MGDRVDARERCELLVVVAGWLAIIAVAALGMTVGLWLYY